MVKEALDRVKATYAYGNDLDAEAGSFRLEDIKALLDYVEHLEYTIRGATKRLEDMVQDSRDNA